MTNEKKYSNTDYWKQRILEQIKIDEGKGDTAYDNKSTTNETYYSFKDSAYKQSYN